MIKVHNLTCGTVDYSSVQELKERHLNWIDDFNGECKCDVLEDDRLIILHYIHFEFEDADTSAVIIKDELDESTIDEIKEFYEEAKRMNQKCVIITRTAEVYVDRDLTDEEACAEVLNMYESGDASAELGDPEVHVKR